MRSWCWGDWGGDGGGGSVVGGGVVGGDVVGGDVGEVGVDGVGLVLWSGQRHTPIFSSFFDRLEHFDCLCVSCASPMYQTDTVSVWYIGDVHMRGELLFLEAAYCKCCISLSSC